MSVCGICAYAAEHGSWPTTHAGTHCGDDGCHRSWTAMKEAHCMGQEASGDVCHKHFSTDSLADKHRKGDYCMTADEMRKLRTKSGKPVFRECDTSKGTLWRNADSLRLSAKPAFLEGK